jgi:hypothetical protein
MSPNSERTFVGIAEHMPDRDELMAEAEKCRRFARDVDSLTMRILNELADQYEAEASLLSADAGLSNPKSGSN